MLEGIFMSCVQCGGKLKKGPEKFRYRESGLENIILVNVPVYRCRSCKETQVEIPYTEKLHLLIALVLLFKPTLLIGPEARYLRKHLGYTMEDWADAMGVKRVTVARWEAKKGAIKQSQDKHLRLIYVDKKGDALKKLSQVDRIIKTVLGLLPIEKTKQEFKIRTEDWAPYATA